MAKNIPGKEFKEALKALNEVLKTAGEDTIKVVGIKKEVVVEEFTNKILDFIEKDKAADLPDETIDFYNKFIVIDDADDTDDADEEKPKKGKEKKPKKEKKARKEKKSAGPKVGYEIIRAIVENDNSVDRELILNAVAKIFPDREKSGMKTTVGHVCGVMKNYFQYTATKK